MTTVRLLIAAFLLLFAAACSQYEEDQLAGAWSGTIPFPEEERKEVEADLPEDTSVTFYSMPARLVLNRDESYRMTLEMRATYVGRRDGDNIVGRFAFLLEMRGEWSLLFGNLVLGVEALEVSPKSAHAREAFRRDPSLKDALVPEEGFLAPRMGWAIRSANRHQLVLYESSLGEVKLSRAGG